MELFRNPIIFKKPGKETETKRVAFVPAFPGAGASFITVQKALYTAGDVNVIELGKPSFYLAFGMEKRFAGKDLVFYEDVIGAKGLSSAGNSEFGINWFIRRPKSKSLDQSILLKCVALPPKGNNYYDMSSMKDEDVFLCLSEMDEIYLILDPYPSKLIEFSPFIEKLLLCYPNARVIVNKMNKGVYKNELKRFLGNKSYHEIPFYPPEEIYRSQFNCSPCNFT